MLIRDGTVVDANGVRRASVRIDPFGKIAEVHPDLGVGEREEVVDARGCYVIPGGVDVHTHLHLPVGALQVSDDFESGTRAAALGGTTTIVDYATAYRGEDPLRALATWRRWAEPSSIDWSLHLTFTESVPERIVAECVESGVSSFKLYMAYPGLLQVDDDVILDVMRAAHRHGALVAVHCEDGRAIEELRTRALASGHTDIAEHPRTRPPELEAEAVTRLARLADAAGCPAYAVHISSAPALAAAREAQERGVDLRVETCPQYLYLDAARFEGADALDYVCTPPLREGWHRDELWEGLARGWIHVVATDHCPFWRSDRRAGMRGRPEGAADFTEVPSGLPGIETRMALIWTGVRDGRIGLEDWIRLCSEMPARTFGLWPMKGSLMPGADADVVIWNPDREQRLDAQALDMAVDHSPYADRVALGWADRVLLRGRTIVEHGRWLGEPGIGRFVHRRPRGEEPLA